MIDDIAKVVMDKHSAYGYEDSEGIYRHVDFTTEQASEIVKTVISAYEAAKEPVSLEDCARGLHGAILGAGDFDDWWHGERKEFGRKFLGDMTKAVLDAAGVPYKEGV
jgi:hypothetical protein